MNGHVMLDLNSDFIDGTVHQDDDGYWWLLRFEGAPPIGFRGTWSGWVDWPISARKARKLASA